MHQLRAPHPEARRALLLLILALWSIWACARRGDPQAALEHATRTFQHGQLVAATKEAQIGYARFRDLGAGWGWKFLILEANALTRRGLKDQALRVLSLQTGPPSDDLRAQKEWVEATALIFLHRLAEAELKLRDIERLCVGDSYAICADRRARGWLEEAEGRRREAEVLFAKTLNSARASHDQFLQANALLALSEAALRQEHFEDALEWANAAYETSAVIEAQSIAQDALGNEGWAYYRLGEPEKAFGLFVEARDRAHNIGAVSDEVRWLTTAGYVYLDAHEYDKAEQSYHQALDLATEVKSQEDIIDALMSLALVSERSGKLEQARGYADKTISLVPANGNRLDVLYPMLVKGRIAARLHEPSEAEKTFHEIEEDPKSHVSLKWEAEHALAQLYEEQSKPELADFEYRAALSTYETARSSLKHLESVLPFPSNAARIYDDYVHFLVSQGKIAEALETADHSRARTLIEGLGELRKRDPILPTLLPAQSIARAYGAVLLYYWVGDKESFLWAITREQTKLFHLPPAAQINAAVGPYRRALESTEDILDSSVASGIELYRMLVQPARGILNGRSKIVILASDSLNEFNFETLVLPDPKPHFWIEDVAILNAASLRLLGVSLHRRPSGGKLMIIGDPATPSPDYPTPRQAASEIEKIKYHFPVDDEQVLVKERATPNAYLTSRPEQFSYIHFVTHGTASEITPLDSSIILSREHGRDSSFRLYARDIIRHPLQAELVTISACYGAGSRVYTGEGLVGLSWAFLRAGARYVVGALWDVSDASSPQLMDTMYAGIRAGKPPEEALRLAKLSLLRSNTAFRKPFYWAPFQLYTGS